MGVASAGMTRADVHAPVVSIAGGAVSGSTTDGISAFLGIPYAAPPVGPDAFAAPKPAPSWDGVRDATAYGPTAPQAPYPAPIAALLDNVIVDGDDYLNLNVWTPDPGGAGLPVMVWIHGGAFTRGSNRITMYAGDTFARDGVVCVGINYRLGTPGFASVAGAPENRGLLDQIAALRWVRENISAFGGDPDNITVFGESAGAMSVASLLSSPRADGLFGRAIMESGNGNAAADPADARKVTDRLAALLRVDATADALGQVSGDELLKAQTQVALELMLAPDPQVWGESIVKVGLGIMSQFPVIDGDVLTARPVDAIGAGAGASVPLLAGWNADEFRFFMVATGGASAVTEEGAAAMLSSTDGGAEFLRNRLDAGVSPGDALSEALSRAAFSGPTTTIAEVRGSAQGERAATHLYEFGYESPQGDIRAGHAVEIPFVFDHLDEAHALVGPEPDQRIADDMHATWVRFATSGDPGWSPYAAGGEIRRFD